MKKKFVIVMSVIAFLIASVFIQWKIYYVTVDSRIVFGKGGISKSDDLWGRFVVRSKEGQAGTVYLHWTSDSFKDNSDAKLKFNGKEYIYKEGKTKKKFKYLLELRGTMPMAATESHYIILSDVQYTFDEIALSMYSSDSREANIPYLMIHMY